MSLTSLLGILLLLLFLCVGVAVMVGVPIFVVVQAFAPVRNWFRSTLTSKKG